MNNAPAMTEVYTPEDLILNNLGLVDYVARGFSVALYNVEFDDLIQMGRLGLISAARNYDPERGTKFATYAAPMIRGTIKRFLREGNLIKTNEKFWDTNYKIYVVEQNLENELQRQATIEEISEVCGFDLRTVSEAKIGFQWVISLESSCCDRKKDSDDELLLKDMLCDDCDFTEELFESEDFYIDVSLAIKRVLKNVEGDTKRMIKEYFESFLREKRITQKYLAQKYTVSQPFISRTKKKYSQMLKRELAALGYNLGGVCV